MKGRAGAAAEKKESGMQGAIEAAHQLDLRMMDMNGLDVQYQSSQSNS